MKKIYTTFFNKEKMMKVPMMEALVGTNQYLTSMMRWDNDRVLSVAQTSFLVFWVSIVGRSPNHWPFSSDALAMNFSETDTEKVW